MQAVAGGDVNQSMEYQSLMTADADAAVESEAPCAHVEGDVVERPPYWTIRLRLLPVVMGFLLILAAPAVVSGSVGQHTFRNYFIRTFGAFLAAKPKEAVGLYGTATVCCGIGTCLPGTPGSACCATERPLFCGAHSTCGMNSLRSAYCCSPGTEPCNNLCLDPWTANRIRNSGGTCNGPPPQGLVVASNEVQTIFHVENGMWDSQREAFSFQGNNTALVRPSSFFNFGFGDFTVQATVIPVANSVTPQLQQESVLFSHMVTGQRNIGWQVSFSNFTFLGSSQLNVAIQVLNTPYSNQASAALPFTNFVPGIPTTYTFIRTNQSVIIYLNRTELVRSPVPDGFITADVDAPLMIGAGLVSIVVDGQPVTVPGSFFSAYVSNIRVSNFADFPM